MLAPTPGPTNAGGRHVHEPKQEAVGLSGKNVDFQVTPLLLAS